ncbi:MAG: glycerophosphodiester phosphodiesterase [Deltaproteobacteria bacterium]|nr:glycerophosphodiester phosphodiesterase [Deltaproteobacteria bacterium]
MARPLVIAHRGASGQLAENTLPAYELAIEQRADMIEIDLHRTRDGATVIAHDEELSGLGGKGEIAAATLAEVRALDAGGGERVPTLDEVLDRFGERIPFNLELKRGSSASYEGLERAALDAVRKRGLLEQTLFSSFFDPVLERLRALAPEARLARLFSPRDPERPLERARAVGAEAINPWRGLLQPELIEAAHAEGLAVYVFTVDEEQEMRSLLDLGVDGIFTNFPDRLRALLPH